VKRSPLLTAVRRAIGDAGRPAPGETLVLGLSGGADSVALLDALNQLSARGAFDLVAAHLDHGLREGSAADAAFCAELCRRLDVPLRVARSDVRARARAERGGLEQAARRARYEFLREVLAERGPGVIAVAHTRDDQAETVLLRLLRGAGRRGLGGMRPLSGDLLRPLLAASRQQVLAHLASRGLDWREDPTNADHAILRNRVRHELLPYLEARFNPRLRETLARSGALLADEAALLARLGAELTERIARREDGGVFLDRAALTSAPRALARIAVRQALEAAGGLRGVSALHVERFLDVAASKVPAVRCLPLPGGRTATFRHREVHVRPRTPARPRQPYAGSAEPRKMTDLAGRLP
jgi:tRNA(Ile)-lysidine synthase